MKKRTLVALILGAAVLVPASAMAAAPRKGVVIDFRAHSKTATVAAAGRLRESSLAVGNAIGKAGLGRGQTFACSWMHP